MNDRLAIKTLDVISVFTIIAATVLAILSKLPVSSDTFDAGVIICGSMMVSCLGVWVAMVVYAYCPPLRKP
jgi:hypothetical protein